MAALSADEVYERHIKPLPPRERLRLLARVAQDLAETGAGEQPRRRSILEFEGVGADNLIGMDAQEYVNELRREWDHRP